MAQPLFANNVAGLLAANVGPSDTAFLLGAGQGALFPAITAGNWYYAVVVHNTLATWEVVKVTGKSADTLTVVRGQDNTSAQSFTTGSIVELRPVAQMFREIDWHTVAAIANGLATLDGAGKVPTTQLSGVVPLLDGGGKIDMANIPAAVATDAELAAYLPLTGGTISGALSVVGNLTVNPAGDGTSRLNVGNDAYMLDCNLANCIGVRSVANAALGFIAYGTGNNYMGWDGSKFSANGNTIWHSANFDPNAKLNATNPTVNGDLATTGNITVSGGFLHGAPHLVLSTASSTIYLRPNGQGNGTNQGTMGTTGLLAVVDVQSYSDRRLKRNIRKIKARNIAAKVPYEAWEKKADGAYGQGVVAQKAQKYAPEHVARADDSYLAVDKAGIALEQAYSNEARITELEKLVAKQAKLIERLLKKG